jgi:hypothetical protein
MSKRPSFVHHVHDRVRPAVRTIITPRAPLHQAPSRQPKSPPVGPAQRRGGKP